MGAFGEAVGVEVGLATQLNDSLGQAIGVFLLLIGVLEELGGGDAGFQPGRHVVVTLVAQVADQLGGQRLVQQVDHHLAVGGIALGDRAVLDVLTGPLAQALLVAQLYVTHRHLLVCAPPCSASRFAN